MCRIILLRHDPECTVSGFGDVATALVRPSLPARTCTVPRSVIRLSGNESSDTQIGVEEASDGANTEVDLDAAYPSDSTQDAFE